MLQPEVKSRGTLTSKINATPKGVYLPLSKLHSILAVANLLAHNNKSQICYWSQISLQIVAVNCSFFWQSDTFGGNIDFAGDGTVLLEFIIVKNCIRQNPAIFNHLRVTNVHIDLNSEIKKIKYWL